MQPETSEPGNVRRRWSTPKVLTAKLRDAASPFESVRRADSAPPGLYTNIS
jgi:hypothetical protein